MAVGFDVRLGPRTSLQEIQVAAAGAEASHAATVWASDTIAEPFILTALLATTTASCEVGTAIVAAFGRSPYATAQAAWTCQQLSNGRAVIGLGPQVKAHVERRFGMPWYGAVRQMREYVDCFRAIMATWQSGELFRYEGEFYRFDMTNPEFSPPPSEAGHYRVPVWLAAVGPGMARLAGEIADGVHVHAFHTPSFLREEFWPHVEQGAAGAARIARPRSSSPVLAGVAHDETEARQLREKYRAVVAFYASTPAYLPVLEHLGIAEINEPLRALSRARRWDEMHALVDDSVLEHFVTIDDAAGVGRRLRAAYDGVLSQLGIYRGGEQFMTDDDWDAFLTALT